MKKEWEEITFLIFDFDQAFRLLKNAKTAEVVNVKEFLTTVIDVGEHMKQDMSQLLELVKLLDHLWDDGTLQ